jgi:Actinobacteria/chloroflexi VLRF1 release factor
MGGVAAREVAGGRRVEVAPERVPGWLTRFAERHGEVTTVATPDEVVVTAADGAVARLQVPFPPLTVDQASPDRGIAAHVLRPRRVGVLLVRLGGHAVGVFDGDRLEVSKVGSRQVHGRSAAGGWSQQRFARRREGQVRVALAAAADLAATLLVPVAATLDAMVLGGDRRSVDTVLADVRLAPLRPLVVPPLLDVPDPRRAVLDSAPARFRAVRITLVDPPTPDVGTRLDSPNG